MIAEERETVIQFDDSSDNATIYTCHKWLYNSLIKRKLRPRATYENGGKTVAWEFTVPTAWIRVSPPRKGGSGNPEALRRARMAKLPQTAAVSAENHD